MTSYDAPIGYDAPIPYDGESGAHTLLLSPVTIESLVVAAEAQIPPSETPRLLADVEVGSSMVFAPRILATPPPLSVSPIKRIAFLMPPMTLAAHKLRPRVDYSVETGDVGRLQVIVGGTNVTFMRSTPVLVERWKREAPIGPTEATFRMFLTPWDIPGEDDLSMLYGDAPVEILLVRPDGSFKHLWEGFLGSEEDSSGEGREEYVYQCEGTFYQASHWPWDPPVSMPLTDVGYVVADALNAVPNRRWKKIPRVKTGILTQERGDSSMSTLQYVTTLLSKAWTEDQRQVTLARTAAYTYVIRLKSAVATPQFTYTKGAPGVDLRVRRDFSQRRDAVFGRGYAPDGGFWCGRVFPGAETATPPRYPMNNTSLNLDGRSDSTTDTGNGISTWQRRMRHLGYPVKVDGVMNAGDAVWVRKIQRDRGITVDSSLGPQTWTATFEDNTLDMDLTTYRNPLAWDPNVWPWLHSASGVRIGKNPLADKRAIIHASPEINWGTDIAKSAAFEPSRRVLNREKTVGTAGTLTARSDPHEDGTSRLDIVEGVNILLDGHRGGTVVQVASVDYTELETTFAIDTVARDAMALEAVLQRTRDGRRDTAGRLRSNDRASLNNSQVVQYESESKAGRFTRTAVNGDSGLWTVRKIFVSQSGVAKVEFNATSPKAELCLALFNRPIRTSILASRCPDPLSTDDDWYANEEVLREKYGLMAIIGSSENPGGYYPKPKSKGGALTGKLRDAAGLPYDSPFGGYVWVAVYTSRSTWVDGRIFPAVPQ